MAYNTWYEMNDRFNFGKRKGELLSKVIDDEPTYVWWCIVNVDWFIIKEECFNALIECMAKNPERQRIYGMSQQKLAEELRESMLPIYQEKDKKIEASIKPEKEISMSEAFSHQLDYDPIYDEYSSTGNPWVDVFGPGEEAETAYWNTH